MNKKAVLSNFIKILLWIILFLILGAGLYAMLNNLF